MNLRVKFSKHGALVYIGHLDVMRYFQKCIRRAEIDVAYTGGFSPHQIMTFAQPLGVGIESNAEYMDIRVNSMTSTQDVMDALNQASVPEIRITNVTVLPENAGNAMASVFAAKYTMDFRPGKEPEFFLTDGKPDADKMKESFDQLMAREVIPYEKETKKGVREMNLKEGIFECTFLPETLSFTMTLNASSAGNIKPSQIMESWLKPLGYEVTRTSLRITREEIYVNEGTEDEIKLVPMDQVTGD